jgi:hypothetical protein
LIFKYRGGIFDTILDTLFETKETGLAYLKLYDQVIQKLGFHLSHTDFSSHLRNFVNEEFISKQKNKMYVMTKLAKNGWQLGILGLDRNDNRKRSRCLYQFLILFDRFHQGRQVSKEELDKILCYVNIDSMECLAVESCVRASGTNFCETLYKKISTVLIRMIKLLGITDNTSTVYYYYKEEGFSTRQVMDFLNCRTRHYPLFIGNSLYDEDEIEGAAATLMSPAAGHMIRPISSYHQEQPRYAIRDPINEDFQYQRMFELIWDLHTLQSSYLDLVMQVRKLTENEKEGLRELFGPIESYKIFKEANSKLKSHHQQPSVLEIKILVESIDKLIDRKIHELNKRCQHVLKENYLCSDMLKKIVFRNFVLKNLGAA